MSKKRAHSAVEPAQQPQQTQQQAPTEYSLPKRLAHNDKAIRDGAIAALVKWLDRAEDISELDMMKLWKGLFYCFWMSDKEAVQEELAGNMANILQQVQPERGMLYLDCFFKTLRREWEGLDRLRMDKFMRLVRKFVFSAFRLLQRSDWDPLLGVWITSIIGTDLFEAKNRGLLMHMSDVVLQELVRVHSDEPVVTPLPTTITPAGGKKKKKNKKNNQPEPEPEPEKEEDDEDGAGVIDALSLQRLLAPFYLLLGESKDVALSKRVSEGVFEALIAVVKQDAKEGEEDHVLRPTVLQLLPTMSDKLFQLASAPNILDSVRNRLYPLRMACKEQITRHQLDEKDIFDDHFEEEGEDEGDEGDFEGDEFDFEGDEGDDQFDFGDFEGDEGEEEGEEEEEEAPQLVPVATEKTVPLPRRSSPIVLPQATGKAAKASKAATTTAKPTTKTIQPTTQAVEQPTPQKTTKKKAPTAPTTPQPPPTPPTPQTTTTTKKSKKKAIATPPPPPPPPTPTTTTGKAAKKAKTATTSPKATTNNNNNNNNKAQTPATTKKAKAVAPTQATPPTTTKTAVTGKRKNETAPSPSPAKTQQTPAKGRAKKQ